jgi:hypothetical protein
MGVELIPIDIVDKPQWYMRKISATMKVTCSSCLSFIVFLG